MTPYRYVLCHIQFIVGADEEPVMGCYVFV
jgi:hypothetical protein